MKIIANRSITIAKFEGIDTHRARVSSKSTSDMVNFRINSEGSIKKREGYRLICTLDTGIRAIWTGEIQGSLYCYVLAGNTLYLVDTEMGTYYPVGAVNTEDGDADMFYYRSSLYLIDGDKLYRVGANGLSVPFGYVPLIGKEWDDYKGGEIFEPRNLLNDKGRISYVASENPSSVLRLDGPVSSIDAVFVNDSLIPDTRYSINSSGTVLNISGLAFRDRIMVYFTYASCPYTADKLMKNTHATVFGGINNSRPFLFGGTDKAMMYSASYVSENSLDDSQRVYPQSDAMYFPYGNEFSVGDGRYPISAVCRHYDRLLVFTTENAWMADSNACGLEEFPVMNINSSVGVKSTHGAAMLENFPYTVGHGAVFRWTSDTDELNDCNAYRISEPIEERLSDKFFDNARVFADHRHREILFTCPEHSTRTWVYSAATSSWTSFSGVNADRFFELGSKMGFTRQESIYVFDDAMTVDVDREIVAEYVSGNISFDSNEKKYARELCITHERGDVQVCVHKDGSSIPAATHNFYAGTNTSMSKKRLNIGRSDYVTVKMTAPSESRQIIHALYIGASK